MAWRDLQHFLDHLRTSGDLLEVEATVDPVLEIPEITDRVCKASRQATGRDPPALLFHHPKGSTIPLAINTYGSRTRMLHALGRPPEQFGEELIALLRPPVPTEVSLLTEGLRRAKRLLTFLPKSVRSAPCQQVEVPQPDLTLLPNLQCWPDDGGRFLTFPLVCTKDPSSGERNMGVYRMQVFDRTTAGMHWQIHKHGAAHLRVAAERKERLEVAIALGCDPAVMFSAVAPLPDGLDELMLAGFIRQQAVRVVRCRGIDVEVPANAEIVLEGYVDPAERRAEGPFGDHFGHYSGIDDYPVFHLTGMTMRQDPIYPAILVGRPPMEDGYLGEAIGAMFLPLLRMAHPEIVDLHLPIAAGFHNLLIASVRRRYPRQARKVMHGLWGLGQMMFTKVVVIVDPDVDVRQPQAVLSAIVAHADPTHDFVLLGDSVTDSLDVSSPQVDIGSKLGIDATAEQDTPPPALPGGSPIPIGSLPPLEGFSSLHAVVPGVVVGVVVGGGRTLHPAGAQGDGQQAIARFWRSPAGGRTRLVVVIDDLVAPTDRDGVLWTALNCFDPMRDLCTDQVSADAARFHHRLGSRIGWDCLQKAKGVGYDRPWPHVASMDPQVCDRVDRILREGPEPLRTLAGVRTTSLVRYHR